MHLLKKKREREREKKEITGRKYDVFHFYDSPVEPQTVLTCQRIRREKRNSRSFILGIMRTKLADAYLQILPLTFSFIPLMRKWPNPIKRSYWS